MYNNQQRPLYATNLEKKETPPITTGMHRDLKDVLRLNTEMIIIFGWE